MDRFRSLLLATAACLLAARPSAAQTTFASITGTITDPTGTSVPNAGVEATHVQSGYRYTTQSNEAGIYTLAQLRDGGYTLRVQAAGFKEFVAQDIVLVSREGRRLDVRLELGAVESRIEVTAGAALIETETARISDIRSDTFPNSHPSSGFWTSIGAAPSTRACPPAWTSRSLDRKSSSIRPITESPTRGARWCFSPADRNGGAGGIACPVSKTPAATAYWHAGAKTAPGTAGSQALSSAPCPPSKCLSAFP